MTNLKKIGLTALAGSLAAIGYAQAGALDVTGTARMEYQSTKLSAAVILMHLHKTHQFHFLVQVN